MDGEPTYPVEYVVVDIRRDGVRGAAQFAWDAGAAPLRRDRPLRGADRDAVGVSVLATAEPWDLVAAAYTVEALPYFELFSREALRLAALPEGARIAIRDRLKRRPT